MKTDYHYKNNWAWNGILKYVILPYGLEIVEPQGYLIWDRDKYVHYRLQEGPICSRKDILKEWEKLSKGYRIVIAVYQEDIRSYMIYSVPFFAEKVMCDG